MRIGIEAFRIFRHHKHGMDIAAIELIKNLQKVDQLNEYFIFCFEDDDDTILHETPNFKFVRIPRIPSPIAEQLLLPYLTLKYRLDILHSTGNTSPVLVFCKQIVTVHDIIYLEKEKSLKGGSLYQQIGNIYRKLIVPIAIRKAHKVITVSDFEKEQIIKRLPYLQNRVEMIHNGYSQHFLKKPKELLLNCALRYKLPKEGFLLFHGNPNPKKNTNNILKALYILQQEGKLNLKVVITDIAEKKILRKINKFGLNGLEENIVCVNYINNIDLPDVYNMATAFIYPSLRESFGIPILEAMSCGTPVITSNCTSMPEIAGEAALYTNPESPVAIAETIHQLISNTDLQENLVLKGQLQLQKFNWKQSALKTLHIYQHIHQTEVRAAGVNA